MKHCPTCTCVNCQTTTQKEQIIWQRGRDSADTYPGQFKPASKNISHVTREPNTEPNGLNYIDSFYVDFVDDDEPTLDYALEKTKSQKAKPKPANNSPICPSTGKPSALSPTQRKQIIDICRRNPQNEEIGGYFLTDGTITQERNHSWNKRSSFTYKIDSRTPVVGLWHRHLARLGHSDFASDEDIQAAHSIGLSSYVVYDVGTDNYSDYKWDEIHPKGQPTNQLSKHQLPSQTASHKVKGFGLTDQQKQQIIRHCKRDWSGNAIGGLVLANGTITLEKNQAADPT